MDDCPPSQGASTTSPPARVARAGKIASAEYVRNFTDPSQKAKLAADTAFGRGVSWAWNYGQDVARIGFGFAACSTGFGFILGFPMIAHGIGQIATGSINLRYGRVGQGFSILEFGVYRATGNETAAILTPGRDR